MKQNPDCYFFAKDAAEFATLSKRLEDRRKAGELKSYSLLGESFDEYRKRGAQKEEELAHLCVAAAKADDPAFFRHLADCLERMRSRTLKHGARLPKGANFKASVLQAYGDFLRKHPRKKPMWIDIAERIRGRDLSDEKRRDNLRRQIEAATRKMNLPLLKKRQSE